MNIKKVLYLLILAAHLAGFEAQAVITVVDDHFDDGTLSPDWTVKFENSTSWLFTESGTNLTVTDIIPTAVNTGSGGTYAKVILTKTFDSLADFSVDCNFSWGSGNSLLPMQGVLINLYDDIGNLIASAQYNDAWISARGQQAAIAGSNGFSSGLNSLAFDGTAAVNISRTGNNITVLWNGSSLVSGSSSLPLSRVDLVFQYYAYNTASRSSYFDNESIDLVKIAGNPVAKSNLVRSPAALIASGSFVEPNNSSVQATPILPNDKFLYQFLNDAGDEDWFEFYAKSGKQYTIEIPTGSVGKLINPTLALFDAAGNLLVNQVNSGTTGAGEQFRWTAPNNGLFRIRVTNQSAVIKKNPPSEAKDYAYQIRVFLTDAPQQGIIKGRVLENCGLQGINEAEVSAWLHGGLTDSTLTYKTGEFGLPLNPDNYDLKSLATNYKEASKTVEVIQEDITQTQLELLPVTGCTAILHQAPAPVVQAQQASAIYDEQQGILTVRDVVIDDRVYYAELENTGDYRFQLYRFFSIPGVIHAQPSEYNYNTLVAKLPRVFAFNQTWKIQIKLLNGSELFAIEKVEPY